MINKRKYAWFPKLVNTWRPRGTKALIWFQNYYVKPSGEAYCLRLGFFSYEFF